MRVSSQPPGAPSPADPVSGPALGPLPESVRRVTIRDVAARAGVSTGTVSKALNGQGKLRAETRGRVAAAAKELGFAPNVLARCRAPAQPGSAPVRPHYRPGAVPVCPQAGPGLL